MANSHVQPSMMAETQALFGDLLAHAILSTTLTTPGSGMTLPAFSTQGYVRNGTPTRLVYVNQPAAPVTLTGGAGTYWLAIHHDTHSVVAGYTRQPGTHYLWLFGLQPETNPPGGLVMASVTVTGTNITATESSINYPQQKVAFGGDNGGLAFDSRFKWYSGTLTVRETVNAHQFVVDDHGGDNATAFHTHLNAAGGTNRWAINAVGTAPAYLGGPLTVAGNMTLDGSLTVASTTRLNGPVGINGVPDGSYWLRVYGGSYYDGAATFATTLTVVGNAHLQSHAGIGAPLMPGVFHLNAGYSQLLRLTVTETATITGALTVQGSVTLNSTLGVATALNVGGPATLYSTLDVSGVSTLAILNVLGAATLSTTLTVQGSVTLNSTLGVANALNVGGPATLYSTLAVSGLVTVNNGVTHPNIGGDNVVSFYSTLAAAGGTNRWFLRQDGDAPSYHRGGVSIYANATLANYHLYIGYVKQNNYGLVLRPTDNDTGGGYPIRFMSVGGAEVGSINTSGSGTAFNTVSDVRLKRDIVPLVGAPDVIQALKPISHRWRVDDSIGVGFLAHEVGEVVEGVVTGEPGAVDAEGNVLPQQIDYSKLVPWLVGALQAVMARLETLEERV